VNFERTVISIANLKESLVYFEHVIPLNLPLEIMRECLKKSFLPRSAAELVELGFPPVSSMYPPEFLGRSDVADAVAK